MIYREALTRVLPVTRIVLLVSIISLCSSVLSAQIKNDYRISYSSKFVLNISEKETPFWGWANQHGIIDRNSSNLISSLLIGSPGYNLFSDLYFSFNTEILGRVSETNTFFLPQAYGFFEISNFDLQVGRFYRTQVIGQDRDATIGSLLVSDNANALIGYNLKSKRFLSVPLLQGYLEYKFSYGDFLARDRYVQDVFFHSKDFYLQVHIGRYKLSSGIIHNAFWGGKSPVSGNLPSSLADYKRIVLNNSGGDNALSGERINRLGNSISGYDHAMSYEFDNFKLQISKLFFIEDRPASRHRSPWDGQWNATLDFKNHDILDYIVYDHVNTKRQDTKVFEPYGRANYYTHFLYRTGFTNRGFVLGNPLIELELDENGIAQSVNNVLIAHHLGVKGRVSDKLSFSQRMTYSRNYGNCFDQLVVPGSCNYEPDDNVELIPLSELRKDAYYFSTGFNFIINEKKDTNASITLNYDFGELEKRFGLIMGFKTMIF